MKTFLVKFTGPLREDGKRSTASLYIGAASMAEAVAWAEGIDLFRDYEFKITRARQRKQGAPVNVI